MVIDERLIKIAYKKLKSSLYYDKTQSILRDPVYCGDCLRALLIQKDTKQRVEAVYRMEV